MDPASPCLSDVPDQILQAIGALKKNTTFLWKSFGTYDVDKKVFTCPIRHTTYERIKHDLIILCDAGYFEFHILHGASVKNQSVVEVEISKISDHFRELICSLFPESNQHSSTELSPLPVINEQVAVVMPPKKRMAVTTRPLTQLTQPRWLMDFILSRLDNKIIWILLFGGWLLVEGIQWFARPQSPQETITSPVYTDVFMDQTNGVNYLVPIVPPTPPSTLPASEPVPIVPPTPPPTLPASESMRDDFSPAFMANQLYTPVVFPTPTIHFPKEMELPGPPVNWVSKQQEIVVVDIPRINLREVPFFQGLVVKQLEYGTTLHVHSRENGWLRVTDTASDTGWVMAYATRDFATQHRTRLFDSSFAGVIE